MSNPQDEHETAKMSVTSTGLRSLAGVAKLNGKADEFIDVALDWIDQASAEINRLRAALATQQPEVVGKTPAEQALHRIRVVLANQRQYSRDDLAQKVTEEINALVSEKLTQSK